MPRSILLGRPMPGPGEPLFLPQDRWWAMALLEAESGLCGDCGHPLAETTDAANEEFYDADATKCHGCIAAARRVAALQEKNGKTEGLKISVFRREKSWAST